MNKLIQLENNQAFFAKDDFYGEFIQIEKIENPNPAFLKFVSVDRDKLSFAEKTTVLIESPKYLMRVFQAKGKVFIYQDKFINEIIGNKNEDGDILFYILVEHGILYICDTDKNFLGLIKNLLLDEEDKYNLKILGNL